jgi:hypothetical protein
MAEAHPFVGTAARRASFVARFLEIADINAPSTRR